MTTRAIPAPTKEDVLAAWDAYYARPAPLGHIPIVPYDENNPWNCEVFAALERALASDRKRVAERE